MPSARPNLRDARVVPWSSWHEWSLLWSALAAGDHATAEDFVRVYRLRRPAGVPVALQAGVTLSSQLSSFDESYTARLGLSMMLARLVNGLTDRLQPTGTGASARSVRVLAVELALPTQLVALRHLACHNALPRGDALQDGARAALTWLEERYFCPQAEAVGKEGGMEGIREVFEGATNERSDGAAMLGPDAAKGTLLRMYKLVDGVQTKKTRLACARGMHPTQGGAKKRRWTECGNEELWRNMPLGLCPWQTEVCTELTGFDEGSADDAEVEVADDVNERMKPAKVRKLREDERRYVEEFRSLLKRDIAATPR